MKKLPFKVTIVEGMPKNELLAVSGLTVHPPDEGTFVEIQDDKLVFSCRISYLDAVKLVLSGEKETS